MARSNYRMILSSLRQVSTCTRNRIWLPYCIAEYRIILSLPIYTSGGPQVPYALSENYFPLVFSNLVSNYFFCSASSQFLHIFCCTEFGHVPHVSYLKPLLTSMIWQGFLFSLLISLGFSFLTIRLIFSKIIQITFYWSSQSRAIL